MTTAIILAAGKGARMGSERAKVLHELAGRALVLHVLDCCRSAGIQRAVVVVGHQRAEVEATVAAPDVVCALQDRQLGTGHAVQCAREAVGEDSTVVVLCGDAPLVSAGLLNALLAQHATEGNACTAVAARLPDPSGYGRMITDAAGRLRRIVEQRDASAEELRVDLVNSGLYAFQAAALWRLLACLRPDNAQGEYYLTDVVALAAAEGSGVGLVITDDAAAVLGINTPAQLAEAEAVLAAR